MSTVLVTIEGQGPSGAVTMRLANNAGHIDTDLNVYEPRLIQAGNFERELFDRGRTLGQSRIGFGEIVVNNADGDLDYLLDVAFDGRRVTIARADGPTILIGTVGGLEFRRREISFRLRDSQALVAARLAVEKTYAGTNSGSAGLEGTADDWKGQTEPQAFGKVRIAAPPMVNTSRLILQASHRAVQAIAIDAILDGGASITAGANYTTLADVEATAPSAATYRAFLGSANEGAYVRLGSSPARILTASITEGATSADRTAAQIMRRVLRLAGLGDGQIAGVAAMDREAPWLCGYWCEPGAGVRIGTILDALAASVHGYWIGARDGSVRLGLFRAPAAPAVAEFADWQILENGTSIQRVVTETEGLPVWRVTVKYQRVWQTQSRDQLAGVALADQERLGNAYRSIVREDPAIRARHPLAQELTVETVLDLEADATALRDVLWALYSVQRDTFEIAVECRYAAAVELGDTVRLIVPRFGLSRGKLFRVVRIVEDLRANISTLTLWG